MGWPKCNSTLEDARIDEIGLFKDDGITYHTLTLWISGICGLIATAMSLFLMTMHATRYSKPIEQRHIIRILFMVPVYALVSFLSYYYYVHSTYYEVLRDCYEAFAIASFFSLMCAYIAPDLHAQKEYFRAIKPKPWIWPVPWIQKIPKLGGGETGWLRTPRSGLTWFNVIWVSVFQYCFIRVFMTIVAVVTNHFHLYCVESLNPAFSHVWVMVIEGVAVTITMYCIIQFYWQIKDDIKQYKPILKVLSIKLVIFLSFWQTILISFLTSSGAIQPSKKIQTPDIKIGIASMLLCIEMAIFSVFHIWAFSWKPYVIGSREWQSVRDASKYKSPDGEDKYQGGFLGLKAFLDCWNPWDLVKATGRSARWLFSGRKTRHQDASYTAVNDINAQKLNDLESSTTYAGAGTLGPIKNTGDEGITLLSNTQTNPANPFSDHHRTNDSGDSHSSSPWAEVEAKEYFQDQQMRRAQQHQRPQFDGSQNSGFESAPTQTQTAYDKRYYETSATGPPPSGPRGYRPPQFQVSPASTTNPSSSQISEQGNTRSGGQPLPFVTRSDIDGRSGYLSRPPAGRGSDSGNVI